MKDFLLLLGFLCLFLTSNAQNQSVLDYMNDHVPEEPTIYDLQKAFNDWADGKDLDKLKGWKYVRRWLWSEAFRTGPEGKNVDKTTFVNSLRAVMQDRMETSSRSSGSWLPEGPNYLPEQITETYQQGIGRINCIAFHPTDENTLFVGTPGGGIWKTTNHGDSWTPLGDNLPVLSVSHIEIDPNDPDVMYLVTGDFDWAFIGDGPSYGFGGNGVVFGIGILKTEDGGQTWDPTGLSFEIADFDYSLLRRVYVNPDNSNQLVAAGISGIWTSQDAGDNWIQVYEEAIVDLERDPSNSQTLYAAQGVLSFYGGGEDPDILKSTDFGANWQVAFTINASGDAGRVELDVAPSDPNTVYAAVGSRTFGAFYGFYRSKDAGANWELTTLGDTLNLFGSRDGDTMEDFFGQSYYDMVLLVDPEDADKVYTGGINSWGSEDGGESWSLVTHWTTIYGISPHADHHQLEYNPLNNKKYLCTDGGVSTTDDIIVPPVDAVKDCGGFPASNFLPYWDNNEACFSFPTEWELITGDMQITEFYKLDVHEADNTYMLAGSQDNAQFYRNQDGWFLCFQFDGMDGMIHPSDPQILWASSQQGNLGRSLDGGQNVEYYLNDYITDFGGWVTPFELNPENPDIIYGAYGNVWKSENGGNNWESISNFSNLFTTISRQLVLSPSNPDHLALIKSSQIDNQTPSNVYVTYDVGDVWIEVTNDLPQEGVFLSDVAFGNDSIDLYVAYAGYVDGQKIYRTVDEDYTWENITKNLPNIPVLCMAHQQGSQANLVYIGTDFGVYYTHDGTDEWIPYTDGLPNVRITDIELDTASNKIFIATYGRGIWSNDLIEEPILSVEDVNVYNIEAKVIPNPNKGRFNLELKDVDFNEAQLSVIDIMGRRVYEEKLTLNGPVFNKTLDLNLKPGLYYLSIEEEGRRKTVRFEVY